MSPALTSYDEIPYESHPYPQSHPERLATVATLFGMTPPPIDKCRVLELGCAAGGNLIPLAQNLPGSTFLGVELSARQADDGRATIEALKLGNVELRQGDITEMNEKDGLFDYIICHGVFSWVPPPVQDKILELCTRNLAPQGVAYVSYNTYPGWHFYGMLRDMMLFHASRFSEPKERLGQARALLDFLDKWTPDKDDPYGLLLKRGSEMIRSKSDWYLYHDHLEMVNEPLYFHEFINRAHEQNLQYLGEADLGVMVKEVFTKEVQEKLDELSPNILYREQYMDFLRNRTFRQTLLCHSGVSLRRNLGLPDLINLYIATALRPVADTPPPLTELQPVEYKLPDGQARLTTADPMLKAALAVLGDAWPASVAMCELWNGAWKKLNAQPPAELSDALAHQHRTAIELGQLAYFGVTQRLIELHVRPAVFAREPGEKPLAAPLVRHQAARGRTVTNLRHETIPLSDFDRQLLPLLDGSRDRAALIEALCDLVKRGVLTPRENEQPITDPRKQRIVVTALLERNLPLLAKCALLQA